MANDIPEVVDMTVANDLGNRAVACKHWRWMAGMLSSCGRRLSNDLDTYPSGIRDGDGRVRPDNGPISHDSTPDLTDPATLGCLLALVREAWASPQAHAAYLAGWDCYEWSIAFLERGGQVIGWEESPGQGLTEAEALVAALEAAP